MLKKCFALATIFIIFNACSMRSEPDITPTPVFKPNDLDFTPLLELNLAENLGDDVEKVIDIEQLKQNPQFLFDLFSQTIDKSDYEFGYNAKNSDGDGTGFRVFIHLWENNSMAKATGDRHCSMGTYSYISTYKAEVGTTETGTPFFFVYPIYNSIIIRVPRMEIDC